MTGGAAMGIFTDLALADSEGGDALDRLVREHREQAHRDLAAECSTCLGIGVVCGDVDPLPCPDCDGWRAHRPCLGSLR